MRSRGFWIIACLSLLLSGCGHDYNGWGEYEGWGGYTQQFGDVKGYGFEEVGLCTYIGGCLPGSKSDSSDTHDTVHDNVHDAMPY